MKTIKDLKDLLKLNEGKIEMGKIVITTDITNTSDIDIKFDGDLMQWFSSVCKDEDLLSEESTYSTESSFIKNKESAKDINDLNYQLRRKNEEIEKLTEEIKKIKVENLPDIYKGKIEAYEKLLIGRDLTISK